MSLLRAFLFSPLDWCFKIHGILIKNESFEADAAVAFNRDVPVGGFQTAKKLFVQSSGHCLSSRAESS